MRTYLSGKKTSFKKPPGHSRYALKPMASLFIIVLMLYGAVVQQSFAMNFSSSDAKTTGNLDITLSYGAMWRVENPDKSARGWTSFNEDDGNRNFDKGLVSNQFKVLGEVAVNRDLNG